MSEESQNNKITGNIPRIAIDANTFRNLGFINFLQKNKELIRVHLPSIVFLEVGYYFMSKGISWDGFVAQLQKLNSTNLTWNLIEDREVLEYAIANKESLPFKLHFRDFIIGVQCMNANVHLITHNKRHFHWCSGISVFTPEEFTASFLQDD